MIAIRSRQDRGHANFGWLDSYHSFSFGNYYDPSHMGFRSLRVINDDRIAPGAGFGTHGHRDMEIITYVLDGAVEHKDSLGTGSMIRPGEIQRMTAGTGILHSEFNPSAQEALHLLQIWILPEKTGLDPSYEQKPTYLQDHPGKLRLIAAADGREGAVTVHQDMELHAGWLNAGDSTTYPLKSGRYAWVQVARGIANLNGHELREGDGAAIGNEEALQISTQISSEVLVFDLA